MNNDLNLLIDKLPSYISSKLYSHKDKKYLTEIILDFGRRPEARFNLYTEYISRKIVSWQDLDYIVQRISKFSIENRAGIQYTLHRISCIRNRQFVINGLTCRVGRSILGTISIIRDLLESGKSILIVGKPGIGKTTVIREIARVLADEMEKFVIIIDTSNEIAGENDLPHLGIGRSRRMQVSNSELQHQVMMEAVENHTPHIIIIDEISTELEVLASRTIAEKGVQLIGTSHGNSLKNLIKNPLLVNLLGGIQYVTLSDEEAKRRKTQKSILERKTYPTFEILIEIHKKNVWLIHENVRTSIDLLLRENKFIEQTRLLSKIGKITIKVNEDRLKSNFTLSKKTWNTFNYFKQNQVIKFTPQLLIIYSYSLPNNLLKEILLKLKIKFIVTKKVKEANMIIGLKKHIKLNLNLKKLAKNFSVPIYSVNSISYYQIFKLFYKIT